MTPEEVDTLLAALRRGCVLQVPYELFGWPETRVEGHELRLESGAFSVRTTFYEHAPGHGWSGAQHDQQHWTEARLREVLAAQERSALRLLDPA